jgi:hypothetical protein
MTPLAHCTRPRQPIIDADRIGRRFFSNTLGHTIKFAFAAFILKRDEHDALGGARHLTHQY